MKEASAVTILVTGGAGFIGSHLIERLLDATDEPILCVDRFTDDYDPALKRENVAGWIDSSQVTLVECDLNEAELWPSLFVEYDVSKVIHLAGLAGVRPSVGRPLDYERANVRGTLVMLEAAREHPVESFLLTSSSTAYGFGAVSPYQEDAPLGVPMSPYGASKRAAELLGLNYHYLHKVPVTCLRPFSVHGPRIRPDLAVSIFTRLIDEGEPITLFGEGKQLRDFTHISDICTGFISAMQRPSTAGEIINLGGGAPIEVRRVIEVIEEQLGRSAQINHQPLRPEEMLITAADLSKAQRLLDYDPRVPFEEGMADYVQWYVQQKVA